MDIIMKIDLSRINLNLLVAFDVLFQEKHVTRAGEKLFITQSAMSNLLKQLRELFNDELFVRGQRSRMLPTARAIELAPHITEALEKIGSIFHTEHFNPKEAKIIFTIGMSDYAEFVVLPPLVRFLTQQAPNIEIVIKALNFIPNENDFEKDDLDLAIGLYPKKPQKLLAETLFHEQSILVGWKNNPLMRKPLTGKQYAQAEHLVILYYQSREDLLSERFIKKLGYTRKAVVTAPDTVAAIYSLVNTNLICTVLKRVYEKVAKHLPLTAQPIPFSYDPFPVEMVWHTKHKNNPAHVWLRKSLLDLAKKI